MDFLQICSNKTTVPAEGEGNWMSEVRISEVLLYTFGLILNSSSNSTVKFW